jgi:hypothetical protein
MRSGCGTDSRRPQVGVQVTDSPYVVASMRVMTRMGTRALEVLGQTRDFVRCMHSVGAPLAPGQKDVPWPCDPDRKVHVPCRSVPVPVDRLQLRLSSLYAYVPAPLSRTCTCVPPVAFVVPVFTDGCHCGLLYLTARLSTLCTSRRSGRSGAMARATVATRS